MRQTALLLVIAVFGYAANAQLTLRPQIGIENPLTQLSYNNLPSFSPVSQFQPQFGLRADYKFKSGFGPYVGLATNRPSVNYGFSDPATGMTGYTAKMGGTKLDMQLGLQYSTKPLSLSKNSSPSKSSSQSKCGSQSKTESKCGSQSTSMSHCITSHSCCSKSKSQKSIAKRDSWTVSLQPAVGLSYTPSNQPALETKTGTQNNYVYNAGVKTAIVTGMSFEFAKNKNKFLTVSVNYLKGLGDNETTFTAPSSAASKNVTTTLSSKMSGWSASVGIPIAFAKSNAQKSRKSRHGCGEQYRIRCQSVRKI